MIANHGRIDKYDHEFEGRNSRLDGIQAAILNVKLKYLGDWTDHRIMIANHYLNKVSDDNGIVLPRRREWAKQVYHLFVIRHRQRDLLQKKLRLEQISAEPLGVEYSLFSSFSFL